MKINKWTLLKILAVFAVLGLLAGSFFWQADYNPASQQVEADAWKSVLESEKFVTPVRGAEKSIVWRNEEFKPTAYSLVQLHGFSATRQEIAPVGQEIAEQLQMNAFFTRLCGHGIEAGGMGKVTAECMLGDAEEAFAVGKRLGDKVVLLGTSTGAALAFYLAQKYPNDVAAVITVSPNFRPKPWYSLVLKGPVGRWVSEQMPDHSWTPETDAEKTFWTTSYPAIALHEMMNLLSWTNKIDLSKLKSPLMVFYTREDNVVSVDLIESKYAEYGGPKSILQISGARHVLAGQIKSPQNTEMVIKRSVEFLGQYAGIEAPPPTPVLEAPKLKKPSKSKKRRRS